MLHVSVRNTPAVMEMKLESLCMLVMMLHIHDILQKMYAHALPLFVKTLLDLGAKA